MLTLRLPLRSVASEHSTHAYERLPTDKRAAVDTWIARTMHPIKAHNHYQNSAALTGVFTRSAGGFGLTISQFNGAMLAAGLHPINATQLHWTFHIRRVRV
jgi:hypothetical protein